MMTSETRAWNVWMTGLIDDACCVVQSRLAVIGGHEGSIC